MNRIKLLGIGLIGLLFTTSAFSQQMKKNVLFIGIDDLRPALGCYGNDEVKSPSIDELASQAVQFTKAYCQYPVCNPSRRSLLSGLRPERFNYKEKLRDVCPDHVSMPGYFKQNDYLTASIGKLYHGKGEDRKSWSFYHHGGPWENYGDPENYKKKEDRPIIECLDLPDTCYTDGKVTQLAIKQLRKWKDKPFFIGVGFRKPHLPFAAPKKYWDLYDPEQLTLPENTDAPEGCETFVHHWSETMSYSPVPYDYDDDDLIQVPIRHDNLREIIHGYYACISFADAQVKMLLDELKRLDLAKNTIVVLWSDHGWNLGEQHILGKHSCYEYSCRVPLLILDPDNPANGKTCASLVELVDLFPTLSELAGLPAPPEYDGRSLAAELKQPKSGDAPYSFTSYTPHSKAVNHVVGNSVRSEDYRYTLWRDKYSDELLGEELYRLKDGQGNEKVNLVNQKKYQQIKQEHAQVVGDSLKLWKYIPLEQPQPKKKKNKGKKSNKNIHHE